MKSISLFSFRRPALAAAALLALSFFGLGGLAMPAGAAPFDVPADLGSYTVLSCQDLGMSGNSVITSEGVGGGAAATGKAHVRSNGNVVLSGTVQVHGDAVAGPGKQVTTSGNPLITGQRRVATSPFNCTPIDLAALRATLEQSNDNAQVPMTDRGRPGLGGAGGRTINLSGNDGLTLPAGTYLLSGISLSGHSQLRVSGQVRILVTGNVAISGGSHLNLNGNPFQLRLWTQGSVAIASQSNVHAYVYAPTAAVTLSGQMNVVGAIQTKSLQISGGARIRRVLDDALPVITLTAPAEGQSVAGCQVTVAGRATDAEGPIAQVTVNGVAVTLAADGSFSTSASLATADPGLVEVAATDGGGNVTLVSVRVAIVPPTVALTSPAPGALTGTRLVNLSGTSGNATTVTVNGQAAVVPGDGTFRITGFDLGADDGLVPLALAARHCGGEATATAVLDLDTKAPVVSIDSPAGGDLFGEGPITVSGPVTDAHLTEVKVNGVVAQVENQRFTAVGVPLQEGQNPLTAVARDALGRSTTSAAVTVELDTTAPTAAITEPENGAVAGTPQITVRGTVSETNLVSVKVNGVPATVTGTDFVVNNFPLVEGNNFLVAVARDAAGHETEAPRVVAVLDTLAPVVAIDAAALPPLTGDATVTVTGTVADPHLAGVTVNGIAAQVVGGDFAATGVPLQEGANPIVAHAVDTLGHGADSAAAGVTRDSLPPVIAITEPLPGARLGSRTVTVRGTVSDPHLDRVTVGPVLAVLQNGTWEAVGVTLPEGDSDVVARAEDTLGHAADAAPVAVAVDTLPPAVWLDAPADPLVGTSPVTVTGRVEEPHLEEVTVNGVAAVVAPDGTFTAEVPLVEGANTLRATARDTFDHEGTSEPVTYVLDSAPPEPPTITFDQPAPAGGCFAAGVPAPLGGAFLEASPATGQNSQPPAVVVEVVDASGARRSYAATLAANRWSVAAADLGAVDGVTTVLVTATDSHGTAARLSRSFQVDATAPAVRLTLDGAPFPGAGPGAVPPGGAVPTLFGRRIAAGVRVEDGLAAAPPAAVLTLGNAPYVAGTPITAEGTHLLVATATDCAGHAVSTHALFAIDATPPALRSTVPAANARVTAAVPTFSGTSDPDLVRATVNGRPATLSTGGSFSLAPFPWREGRNEVAIELEDRAGHRSSHQVVFTVRTAPLSVRIQEGGAPIAAGSTFLRPVRPEVRASDSTATVTATLNGAPFASGTEIAQSGSYHLVATASDDGGRTAQAEATFALDLGAGPQIAVTSPADAAVVPGPTVRVEGTVSGDAPTVTVNGLAATVTGGTWAIASVPLEPEGATTLVAIARDRRGRTATSGVTVRVVAGGPQILILEPADGTATNRSVIDVAGVVIGGRGGSADGTVTVQGRAIELAVDGTFRALDVPLQTGSTTLTASVVDREGRTGSATVTVTADFTPPAIRFLARIGTQEAALADGASFSQPITLVVEVADDAAGGPAPRIRLNGALRAEGTAPRTEIPLTESGGYVVAAAVEDAAGNETRAERSFVLDFGGCSLSNVTPAAGGAVAAPQVTLVGRAGGAAAVKVRVPQAGGGVQEYVAALADGTFLAGDVPLPVVGENRLELVCVDSAGAAESSPHPIERLAADAGPSIEITAPAAGARLGVDTVVVQGTVSSGAVTVNGLPAAVTPGSGLDAFRAGAVPLAEGPNPLLARAVDAAGRTAEDRVVVHRDTQAPRVQITRPDNHSQVGVAGAGPATIEVSGLVDLDAEPNLDRVVVSTAQGSVTATVDPLTGVFRAAGVRLDPAAGAAVFQTITATATDTLGHPGTGTVEVALLDPTAPAIVLSEPADLTRYAAGAPAQITVRGDVWAAPGTAVALNGVDLDPATLPWETAGSDGRRHAVFTATINLPAADGAFGIIARATDLQGRWAQDRRLLFHDAAAPRVVEMVPANGATGVDGNGLLLVLFSEPIRHASLAAADGLTLTRISTGQPVVGSATVAGQAVGFAPGSALAAGEVYVLRAGAAITDVAGNALVAPAEARFTVATSSTGGAPVLQSLPAVICADEIQVTGTAAPGATLKARDGNLVFTGFADATGAFTIAMPVTGSGYHLLVVWALDPVSGARSPEATAVVRIDCRAPSVVEARFDRATGIVRIVFSEDMAPATLAVGAAAAAIRLLDAEEAGTYRTGDPTPQGDSAVDVQLDTAADAWWRDRPVRLQVGPPAADAEGNAMAAVFETVFFPGGGDPSGGFLFGEAYDDSTGRPLAGATVGLFAASQTVPVASAVTDGRGRFVLAGEVPAGRYVLVVEGTGGEETTRVYRRLALRPAAGVVPFDSRLTPLAEPAGTLEPVAGGSLSSGGMSFAADPAALPGTEPVTVRLTPRSGQGLPDFLPLGWTPVAAAEVRLEQEGQALAEQSLWTAGAARLDLPLTAGTDIDDLHAVRYEPATGRWLALPDPEAVAGGARISVAGPGTVALVVPDADASTRPPLPAAAGEPLAGVERPEQVPALAADLVLDPPVVGPTGRSKARVVARSADGATAWPSGLAVQAFLEERLVLTGGGEVLEAPFSADLVLYHPQLTAAEQGSAAAGAAGALELIVSPSPRAAQVLLEVGWENIRLFPFPEEVERGPVVGPDGGTIETPEGVELTIPEGALGAKVPVAATLLTAVELAALPQIAGYDTLAGVRIELTGATLARAATLSLPIPQGLPSETSGPRVILAELVEAPADGRAALARLAARTRREGSGDGERVVAAPEAAGPLPLDGIVREGLYLVLAAHDPLGFATGFVRTGNGTPVHFSRVTADGLGTGDLSRLTGRYAVPVPAGANRRLVARHPALDEQGTGVIPSLAPGQVVSLDLTVEAVPPRVVSKTPQEGATNQPLATPVSILFSEPLAPATVTSSTLKLELAGPDGAATGIFVDGAVSLVDGVRVVFAPARPLLPGRTFRAHFSGGVADAGGALYAGPPLLWSFATSTAIVPGGQVHPEKFHVRVPVNGVAEIWGDPGALPGAVPGQTPWAVTPEIEGPVADPLRETFQGKADGSFTGTVGHPPGFKAELGSKIWVKVFDPTGALAAHFRVGPFTTPDGLGFVAPAGEAVTFRSAEGLVVDVPAAAFDKATLVRVRMLAPGALGIATPQGLGLGAYVDVDFDGEARETLRVAVPAPAAVPDDAQVFIGQAVDLAWGRRLQFLSAGGVLERDGRRYLSNDPSLQPEPPAGAFAGAGAPRTVLRTSGRTCRTARQEGLNKCFLQSLLMEFTLRSQAAFMYEVGADFAIISGGAGAFPLGLGIAGEAIYNFLADSWVYLPRPHDWNGGFVLPVLSAEPLELVRRDTATGWVLARQTYDPVPGSDGLIDVGFLGSGDPERPLLLDARPFQLYRLPAPEPGETARLSLEMELKADSAGAVTVVPVDGFPVPAGTSITVYDLSPTSPEPVEEGEPEAQPAAPIAGPAVSVCDPEENWATTSLAGSDDLLVVVAPGGLDAAALDRLELQFDRPLRDVTGKPAEQVARLFDLGPLEAGCGSTTAAGYPKTLPLVLDQTDRRSRLILQPVAALAAGHRFRLEILPAALVVDDPEGSGLAYWDTAPTRFEFATREVPGEPIAGMPDGPALGTTSVARDMLKLGNLLLVASETGDLVAIDVSRASEEEGLRRYALKNRGVQSATRSLATDGHNRIFYSGLFGSVWGVKAVRLEDVREASAQCVNAPDWAAGLPCFEGVEGSARIAYALGTTTGTTASEWLALGTLPEGVPMKLAVLAQDEKGKTLELADFVDVYAQGDLDSLTPDAEGIYTFDIAVKSTLTRNQAGQREPSLPPGATPEPAVTEWRKKVCDGEEDYDRYQRVTVDNLTTGQSWSLDVENPWPDGGGDGLEAVPGIRARRGDQLRVRYNLRALGHVALMGSGITVVDLNRFYRLLQPYQTAGAGQCGRRLGKFEGQQLEFPSCAPGSLELQGIAMTPAVVTHSRTGCDGAPCRGEGFIDIYSPLQRVGALHTRSTASAPGGVENGLFGNADGPDAFQLADLAACIQQIDGQSVMLRDVALANDVEWTYHGIHGDVSGVFQAPSTPKEPLRVPGDLLFVSLGSPGVYVFDVSARSLFLSPMGGPALVGRLHVPGHSAFRLQVDAVRGLLFAGGTDASTGKPVIDVWDVAAVNGAPGLPSGNPEPTPVATLHAPWSTNQLGIDATGTGLLYTWGSEEGPLVVPFDRPQFLFSGLYRPEEVEQERGISGVQQATARFVPLGVPVEATLKAERDNRIANERKATAAFKLRVALPGSLGRELTAKVQSLRLLPGEQSLGQEDVGPSVAPPGGPGWPDNEVVVRLRRVGLGSEDGAPGAQNGEAGPLGTAYQLYESVETVLLEADPRARSGYHRQDAPGDETADEKAQCRRCEWPGYLPDPLSNDESLDNVKELLAGRFVRAFLFATSDGGVGEVTRQATEDAIEFFEQHGENYPPPAGWAEIAGPADAVPSPLQVSLAEPAQSPAVWSAGEAGVSVALPGGELLLSAIDHDVEGRAIPFSLDRTYRSGMLGYGPLGSAGWSASLFAHLRELPVTGEVEYHDGLGHVWRFFPRTLEQVPAGYEEDEAGSYYVPAGVYLRLQKLSGGQGWRLIGRGHEIALFDGLGRLAEVSDRHYRAGTAGERGNRMRLRYDPFGQLVTVVDDLERQYKFEYFDDPLPEAEGGDGDRYGLLESVTDFADREVRYEYDDERRLIKVELPEVTNPVDDYAELSYTGSSRPALEYRYDPTEGAAAAETATGTLLHGEFAKLRLGESLLPDFVAGAADMPRARFTYEAATGRIRQVGFPTPDNQNTSTSSVAWTFDAPGVFPPNQVTLRAPWDHEIRHTLQKGRITARREQLLVHHAAEAPNEKSLDTSFAYAEDGRLLSVDRPDGSRVSQCFADGQGGPECEGRGGAKIDRLAKGNVLATRTTALTPTAKGSADYVTTGTGASYGEDNQLSGLTDGVGRSIDLAVAQAGQSDVTRFGAENVSARYEFDRYGRVDETAGSGDGAPQVRMEYGEDAKGRPGAGLIERIERGAGAFWQEFDYDDAYNVERVETSQGTATITDHDTWDRVVRNVSGLATDGRFASVGTPECSEGQGVISERGFDAAGHVARERRLQDYVDPVDGATRCRWVETRYTYNLREQLVEVKETHLASASNPGQVVAAAQTVSVQEYDVHGRLERERTRAASRPDLVTLYTYDSAGRVAATKTGDEAQRQLGYDERSRVVFTTDGDQGVWRGRFDAWGHLYHEAQATGAVVRRRFDEAGNLLQETVFEADPLTDQTARVLSDTRTHFTSFGEMERLAQTLTAPEGQAPPEIRVTEKVFDGSGRVREVWSGPALATDATKVDRDRARREIAIEYEPAGGRVLLESFGGDSETAPLHGVSYLYGADSAAPWPDAVTLLESVPGQTDMVATTTSTYRRDALGRPFEERRSDGSLLTTVYDRSGGAIRLRTGAGAETSMSLDGRGLPVKVVRPNGRGFTLYAYDLDGALLRQAVRSATAELWETVYGYDATGRVETITYADGTSEGLTYNADSTLATLRTRDGLTLTHGYDAANRLKTVTPSLAGGTVPALLDAGDSFSYDKLSRPSALERGRPGAAAYDPALAVRYPVYDLASRPASEVVGGRAPLSWRYDSWDRPFEVTLPAGPGRSTGGALQGFTRTYDTLDRQVDVTGLGAAGLSPTPLGAQWTWGGAGRLYAVTTKGALRSAARYGYHGGAGPQIPGYSPDAAAKWELGTLTWGSAGSAAATAAPQNPWGAFGFGWRGNEGTPSDGAKLGRKVLQPTGATADLFAGMGWAYGYDGGVRLSFAASGAGDLQGQVPAGSDAETFRFAYGAGDELARIVRESTGQIAEIETGDYGRIVTRNGAAFSYDGAGRRKEDDRFVYRWDWRGQLVSVTVKDTWPDADGDSQPEVTPWAGHQVRYDYDAAGRLANRWLRGKLPAGSTDDAERPFIEKRVFVWEGDALAAEAAYGNAEESIFRWRKTYVPGPGGLDDAVQVIVEDAASSSTRTYTLLRDEMGSVAGLVAEDEGSDPAQPPVPARYLYTPYGEAHAETGPELQRARFDGEVTAVQTADGAATQTVADGTAAAAGALVLDWSLGLDDSTLAENLKVEHLVAGLGWLPLAANDVAVGVEPGRLLVLARNGWPRGASYRVRLTGGLEDELGRRFGRTENLEWRVPEAAAGVTLQPVIFDRMIPVRYESWEAATATVGDRFPGGQTALFQGLWTDPVTGVAYARARWYDARNASWLSEDPMADTDSPNLYAFVGWQPSMATDPLGLCSVWETVTNEAHCREYFSEGFKEEWDKDKETVSTVVSFVPGLGDLKDAQEAITGVDLITGRELSWMERGITVAAAFIPVVGGAALREIVGEGAERAAKEGAGAFEQGVERGLREGADGAGEGAERAAREGAGALDEASPHMASRKIADEVEPTCLLNCFAAGTLVSTSVGLVPIEEIQAGDQVYSFDEETGEEHLAEVVALHHRDVEELWVLDAGEERIETTDEHPFYVAGRGWTEAKDLRAGDILIATGGDRLTLEKVERVDQAARVYNFEVRDLHTYLVSEMGVVVHNCGLPSGAGGSGKSYDKASGQGLYVLRDQQGIRYVGRGDAPVRVAAHGRDSVKAPLKARVIWDNNLTKAQAKGLEQHLIARYGGALSSNPATKLLNVINSFRKLNPNYYRYRRAVTPELLAETIKRIEG